MKQRRHPNRKGYKKPKTETASLIESDEHFGFIVGYTSNGVPYGLTHEEINELEETETKESKNKTDSDKIGEVNSAHLSKPPTELRKKIESRQFTPRLKLKEIL